MVTIDIPLSLPAHEEFMYPCKHGLRAFSLSVCLMGLGAGVATNQTAPPQRSADESLRSELSLGGRTAAISYAIDLKASDPAYKTLISNVAGSPPARVRIGQLETTGALRIGTIDLPAPPARAPAAAAGATPTVGSQEPPVARYGVWLTSAPNGWQMEITDPAEAVLGQVALNRQPGASPAPILVAALVAENISLGRLVLRWGGYEAAADVQYTNPSRSRTAETVAVNQTINRRHDEDTSALSRARLLAQRNETALVVPKGARVSISFQRTLSRGERTGNNRDIRGLSVDGPDYARLVNTPVGAIVLLTESAVPRLRTERPLRFGTRLIATGNQVVGFPGSYGLWLKRAAGGWRLVFNHEPDAWGSQHDPQFDAAEIDLAHSDGHEASRPFAMNLIPTAPGRGRLAIVWGPHEWTADFSF